MTENKTETLITLPMLALRGLVAFPGVMLHFEVGRKKSIKALNAAMEKGQKIYLVAQKNVFDEEPDEEGLYEIGCVAKICQILRLSDNNVKVLVEGLYRAKRVVTNSANGYFLSTVIPLEDTKIRNRKIYIKHLLEKSERSLIFMLQRALSLHPILQQP